MTNQDPHLSKDEEAIAHAAVSPMPVWKQTLLWIAVLPGALLGSTVVFLGARLIMWLSSSFYYDDSLFHFIFREIFTNGICGAAFVYCGGYIAPRCKITVVITLAAITLFISSVSFFMAIAGHDWMHLLGTASLIAGAIVTAVSVAKGKAKF